MSEDFPGPEFSGERVKVESDLSNKSSKSRFTKCSRC